MLMGADRGWMELENNIPTQSEMTKDQICDSVALRWYTVGRRAWASKKTGTASDEERSGAHGLGMAIDIGMGDWRNAPEGNRAGCTASQADQRVCSKCPIEFKFERIRGYKMARLQHVVRPRNEIRESLKSHLKLSKATYSYARSIKFNPGVQKMRTSVLN